MIGDRTEVDADIAARALTHYDVAPGSRLELINVSENSTYLVTDAESGVRSVLRVHRHGYHDRHQIESELDWLTALGSDGVVAVPAVLRTRDDDRVVTVQAEGLPRHAVRFAWIPGVHPDENTLTDNNFRDLGGITAALHQHVRGWRRPAGFDRFAWDWQAALGPEARWGQWQDATGVGAAERRILLDAERLMQQLLADYGTGADRYGLLHADLRLANLLVDAGSITVLDFDDCGFGWFFFDFGAAVSFIEHDPALPGWQAAWLDGYRTIGEVSPADEAMLPTFVLFRRLMLLAWMGTHDHAAEAKQKLASYAAGSCALAERYLSSAGRTLER